MSDVQVTRKVGGKFFCAIAATKEQAEASIDEAVAALRANQPMIGWRAKPRGSNRDARMIVAIDHEHGTVKLEGEEHMRRWRDCRYEDS